MFLRHIVRPQPVQKASALPTRSLRLSPVEEAPRRVPPLCGLARVLLVTGNHRPVCGVVPHAQSSDQIFERSAVQLVFPALRQIGMTKYGLRQ